MKYYKAEVFYNLHCAFEFLDKWAADGWRLDKKDLPHQTGFGYYVGLVRDEKPEFALSRVEMMAVARKALADKRADSKLLKEEESK